MTNLAQLLLVVVIITLTFLITLIAVQAFQVLHEARQAIKKFNKLLDNPETSNQTKLEIIDKAISQSKKTTSNPESSRRFFRRTGSPLRPKN